MSKFKACLIGCGDIGYGFDRERSNSGALTHFKALRDAEGFDLCAVSDTRKEIMDEIGEKFGMDVFENAVQMLEEKRPDVIVIASNDETHIPLLKDSLRFSPKLVFCEKPLGMNSQEVIEINDLYRKTNVKLQVNYTRRFLDEFDAIAQEISRGSIGKISSVTFYYSRGLIHNASHYLDLVNWYFGTPKEVAAISSRDGLGADDRSYTFCLGYQNGMEIIFIALEPSKLSFAEIDIVGSEGRIKFNHKNEIEYYSVVSNSTFSGFRMYDISKTLPVKFDLALPNAYRNIFNSLDADAELKCPGSKSVELFEIINRIKNQ